MELSSKRPQTIPKPHCSPQILPRIIIQSVWLRWPPLLEDNLSILPANWHHMPLVVLTWCISFYLFLIFRDRSNWLTLLWFPCLLLFFLYFSYAIKYSSTLYLLWHFSRHVPIYQAKLLKWIKINNKNQRNIVLRLTKLSFINFQLKEKWVLTTTTMKFCQRTCLKSIFLALHAVFSNKLTLFQLSSHKQKLLASLVSATGVLV